MLIFNRITVDIFVRLLVKTVKNLNGIFYARLVDANNDDISHFYLSKSVVLNRGAAEPLHGYIISFMCKYQSCQFVTILSKRYLLVLLEV